MNTTATRPLFLWLTLPLAALIVVASYGGLFWPAIYAREMSSGVPQARAIDAVNVVLAAPLLVLSAVLAFRKSTAATVLSWGSAFMRSWRVSDSSQFQKLPPGMARACRRGRSPSCSC